MEYLFVLAVLAGLNIEINSNKEVIRTLESELYTLEDELLILQGAHSSSHAANEVEHKRFQYQLDELIDFHNSQK